MERTKLAAARYEKGWSQEEVAERVGVTRNTLSKWERGVVVPYPLHAYRLCDVYGKSASELDLVYKARRKSVKAEASQISQDAFLEPDPASTAIQDKTYSPFSPTDGQNSAFSLQSVLEAPSPEQFYGREKELTTLISWILKEQCRLVAVLGMGGIGKTSLAVVFMHQVKDSFTYVFWRSLQHAPRLSSLLKESIVFLSNHQHMDFPGSTDDLISLLIQQFQEHRCLFLLDNCEAILQSGLSPGSYRDGYQDYGNFFQRLGETPHQSCLLFTSREKTKELSRLEGIHAPVRSLQLPGLGLAEAKEILKEKGIACLDETCQRLVRLYAGNPLALKLIAEPLRELFHGDIAAFLNEESSVVGEINDLLKQQFDRLSWQERDILYWLAVEREPVSRETLWEDTSTFLTKKEVLDALASLSRRSMIEINEVGYFTLQPVIMEYVTDELVKQVCEEILGEKIHLLASHALCKTNSKEYIRETQVCLILAPLAERLLTILDQSELEQKLHALLASLQKGSPERKNYAAGNLLNLLLHLHADLKNYDFSSLHIQHAFLRGRHLAHVNFASAHFANTIFTDTFGSILSVAFNPKESLLAAGTTNNDVRLWHIDGSPSFTFRGHTGWVRSVAFSPDGCLLISGSDDQTVRLWNIKSGVCLTTLQGHTAWVRSVAFSPDGRLIASGGEDQHLYVWDADNGNHLKTLRGHSGRIRSIAFSPDSRFLASGGEERIIHVWDVQSGDCLPTLQGHKERIRSIAFSPDGGLLASGSDDYTIRLWSLERNHCLKVLQCHSDCVRSVAFHPHGKVLASGSEDQTVRLWDIESGNCLKTLLGHTNWVWSVAFSADGLILASGSEDQTVRLWEIHQGHCLNILQGYVNWAWSIAFSPDGKILAGGNEDQMVHLWRSPHGEHIKGLQGHTSRVRSVAFAPDSSLLLSSSEDRTLRLWDMSNSLCLRTFQDHLYRIWSVTFSPDGRLFASCGEDLAVCLWDVSDGHCLKTFQGHTDRIRTVAFHSDGKIIASSSEDQTVRLWDVSTGSCVQILHGHRGRVWTVAFCPGSDLLASGGDDSTIRIWSLGSDDGIHTFQGHSARVRSVAFSPDGSMVASGSEDGTLRLWKVSNGSCLALLRGHTGHIRSVAFHPHDPVLVSSGVDGTIRFWDIYEGRCLNTLKMDTPYEQMNITAIKGIADAQKVSLRSLGAIEEYERNDH